jgi:hypothetical protein
MNKSPTIQRANNRSRRARSRREEPGYLSRHLDVR